MIKYVVTMLLILPMLAFADSSRGEKLLVRLWQDMQEGSVDKIAGYTSKQFHGDCPFNKLNSYRMLLFLEHLKIYYYKLSDIRVTEGEKVITVTYHVEMCARMKGMCAEPARCRDGLLCSDRLDVWKKIDGKWLWAAEAVLINTFI